VQNLRFDALSPVMPFFMAFLGTEALAYISDAHLVLALLQLLLHPPYQSVEEL
jgi:hypothetical protein